eukprot:scaffold289690_cov18-Prasinocladus_malaysianus.AAC.1
MLSCDSRSVFALYSAPLEHSVSQHSFICSVMSSWATGTCRCTIMYAGTDCQHGFALQWILSTHYDKVRA